MGVGGSQQAEDVVEHAAEDPTGAGQQPFRVGEVPRARLVDHDLRAREHPREVTDSARMIQVDVRHHDGGQVVRPDP